MIYATQSECVFVTQRCPECFIGIQKLQPCILGQEANCFDINFGKNVSMFIYLYYSELYHGRVWHNDLRFQALTVMLNGQTIYLGDFVLTNYEKNQVVAKTKRFYQKVRCYIYLCKKNY